MSNRVTIQFRTTEEDKELFLFKSRNNGFDDLSSWFKWLAKNAPIKKLEELETEDINEQQVP